MQEFKEDPHGIIPTGWINSSQYEVVCFITASGIDVLSLMVGIKSLNLKLISGHNYHTTRSYIYILKDYFAKVEFMELHKSQDAYRQKKMLEFADANPDITYSQVLRELVKQEREEN